MLPVDHVVVTNVSAPTRADGPGVDADRLWYVLGFFLDACLPSVTRQRDAQPTWLVWFDDRCEPDLRAEIERLALRNFTTVWTTSALTPASVAREVARHSSAPTLITTTIDCDDAMAVGYLARVAALNEGTLPTLVTSPEGLSIDRSGGVFATDAADSPVRSLIEARSPGSPPLTVLGDTKAVRSLSLRGPQWIDVDHEWAPARPRGRRVHPRVVAEHFDIDLTYDRAVSKTNLRASELRRLTRSAMRAPRVGTAVGKAVRGARTAGWVTDSAVNVVADRVKRRRKLAGLTPVAGDAAAILNPDRVAVLAEYTHGSHVRPWALHMAAALAEADYPCLVICARDRGITVKAPTHLPANVAIMARSNARYDFGSWAAALEAFPEIADTSHVLLTNDSIIGPLPGGSEQLRTVLAQGETDPAAVFAATKQFGYLQSYFLLFKQGALTNDAVKTFFSKLPLTRDRKDLVQRYEHGLSQLLIEQDISIDAAWDAAAFGLGAEFNPPLCWRELLDAGFPFLKRRLLTHPRFATVRPVILSYVQQHYGVDLGEGL